MGPVREGLSIARLTAHARGSICDLMKHVVVVGAGQAGSALVAKLRAEGFSGSIVLIGAEDVAPYNRPRLSKAYLLGEASLERLLLRPASFYADSRIDLRLGTTVAAIDRAARRVVLAGGESLPYDALALTTGAVPRRLPAAVGGALAGVFVLRARDDADALAAEIAPGRRVLVVGGGYVGLEAAAVCAQKGMTVTLVEIAPRILGRVACAETADYFRALHRAHGVDIREGVALERLLGEGRVTGALLADGTRLDADLVVAGLGIEPDVALAQAAGLALENGIRTDEFGRTSDPAIFAAGDCASFPHEGRRIRLESVGNAIAQAEAAALAMLGRPTPYRAMPWFWSDQYDCKLQIAGLGTGHDRIVVRGEGAARSHWYYAGARLIAVDAMNDARAYMTGKRLIESGRSPPPEAVADPAIDLKALAAL